jgi:alpha-beta hydrolase superfamily lysophospholipase
MSRKTVWTLGVLGATAITYALGPRYVEEGGVDPVAVFDDVEAYVTSTEQTIPDIVDGAEKQIVWAGAAGDRTERVIVYVHGFSATRQEVSPLCDSVAARLGANLFYTRLKGHGRPGSALAQATAADWLFDVREALAVARALGDRVLLVGSSTGATLAVWAVSGPLPAEETAAVEALILLSPNFGPADPRSELLLMPWGRQLAKLMIGEYREWTPHNDLQGRYWTTRYPTEAIFPMMTTVRAATSADAGMLRTPVLLAYSPDDQVLDTDRILAWYESTSARPRRLIEIRDAGDPSGHILAGDILSPGTTERLVEEITSFVERL